MAEKERIVLTQKECYCDIIDLYDTVLRKQGREPAADDVYEVSKIECSLNVMYEVKQYYMNKYPDKFTEQGFAMTWVNSGPKASEEFNDPDSSKYIVLVEPGWCHKREADAE